MQEQHDSLGLFARKLYSDEIGDVSHCNPTLKPFWFVRPQRPKQAGAHAKWAYSSDPKMINHRRGEGGGTYMSSIHWLDDIKMQSSVMFLGKIFTALPHSTKKYK